jgi:hypothetical protein
VGEYTWKLEKRKLDLQVIEDSCSIDLRGKNLSEQVWESCIPPNEMTGASDHWHKPPGCIDGEAMILLTPMPENISVTVRVHQGDARKFAAPPDRLVNANSEASPPPEGFTIRQSADSIPYGLTRVLWGIDDWIEITTDLPFEAMGVQFLGDPPTGWARLIFDGEEVWRGETSEIWSEKGWFGGYVEITGYQLVEHTLRVESVGIDYHPVNVNFFCFSEQDGVESETP